MTAHVHWRYRVRGKKVGCDGDLQVDQGSRLDKGKDERVGVKATITMRSSEARRLPTPNVRERS